MGSSRLLVRFYVTVVVLVSALAAMGIQLTRQERTLARQRQRDALDAAAELAAAAFHQEISRLEGQLTQLAATGDRQLLNRFTAGVAVLVTGSDRLDVPNDRAVLYYPEAIVTRPTTPLLEWAERAEHSSSERPALLKQLEALRAHGDQAIRAEARLRLARLHWKAGNHAAALDAYELLGSEPGVFVLGRPAELAAWTGRLLLLREQGNAAGATQEASRICGALRAGRWPLSEAAFRFHLEQACGEAAIPPEAALSFTRQVHSLWEWSHRDPSSAGWLSAEHSIVMARRNGPRAAILMLPRAEVEKHLLTSRRGFVFALTDGRGNLLAGRAPRESAVRLASAGGLPWSIHASPDPQAPVESTTREPLLWGALATLVIVVLAGTYFITRATARELEAARLQSDFVASISHEFRTPITALRQLSDVLLTRDELPSTERREFYEAIAGESERLGRTVEDLLQLGRAEAKGMQLRREEVNLTVLLREIIATITQSALGRGYDIHLNGEPRTVAGDREALACVFRNLLENAVKYSPDSRDIEVCIANDGRHTAVEITDHGLGIKAHEQKKIFQKFVRGEEARNRRIRGTGVGLAMARQIVEAHGGEIRLRSAQGQGSTFSVLLPSREQS